MKNIDEKELLRRKEIVEWQIKIAKDYKVIEAKELRLRQINQQLNKYQNDNN